MNRKLDKIIIDEVVKQVLFGSLLGDGCLSNEAKLKSVRYSEKHCLKQENYLLWKRKILAKEFQFEEALYSRNRPVVGIRSRVDPLLTLIRTIFYSDNKKIITKDVLNQLGTLAWAVWYGDDGTYHWQTHSCKIYGNFSYREYLLVQKSLKDKWDIESKIWANSRSPCLKLDAEETRKFLKFIRAAFQQYKIPKCIWYKLGHLYKGNKSRIDLVLAKKRQDSRRLYQNPKIKQQKRNYYLKNREKILKQRKEHYQKPDIRKKRKIYMKKYCKIYQQKNRDKINAYKREWRRKKRELQELAVVAAP